MARTYTKTEITAARRRMTSALRLRGPLCKADLIKFGTKTSAAVAAAALPGWGAIERYEDPEGAIMYWFTGQPIPVEEPVPCFCYVRALEGAEMSTETNETQDKIQEESKPQVEPEAGESISAPPVEPAPTKEDTQKVWIVPVQEIQTDVDQMTESQRAIVETTGVLTELYTEIDDLKAKLAASEAREKAQSSAFAGVMELLQGEKLIADGETVASAVSRLKTAKDNAIKAGQEHKATLKAVKAEVNPESAEAGILAVREKVEEIMHEHNISADSVGLMGMIAALGKALSERKAAPEYITTSDDPDLQKQLDKLAEVRSSTIKGQDAAYWYREASRYKSLVNQYSAEVKRAAVQS